MTTEGKELTIIEQKPEEVVLWGRNAAVQLQSIVSARDKKLMLSGKQYLFFEDWQTIGKFYGVTAKVVYTEEIRSEFKLVGFLAKAVAIVKGEEVSGADAECTYDELNWANKPRFQLRSMAQTRACAKALRNCLGWVAVLAGYEPTPAEEMTEGTISEAVQERRTIDKTSHYCLVHNVPFFKKGKMKSYAHPIGDSGDWCHEHTKGKEDAMPTPEPETETDKKPEPDSEAVVVVTEAVDAKSEAQPAKLKRDPSTVKTIFELGRALYQDFALQPKQQLAELNIKAWTELTITPAEAYRKVAGERKQF